MQDQNETPMIRLSVQGMSCAGCVAGVANALKSVEGVIEANVSFADHTAQVKGFVDADALKKAVRNAGYDAAVMEGLEDLSVQEEQEAERYKLLLKKAKVAAMLLMIGIVPTVNFFDDSRDLFPGDFDEIAHGKRVGHMDRDAAKEVGQDVAASKANEGRSNTAQSQ